mgnify:FL=1|jgi:hypothetical protein
MKITKQHLVNMGFTKTDLGGGNEGYSLELPNGYSMLFTGEGLGAHVESEGTSFGIYHPEHEFVWGTEGAL